MKTIFSKLFTTSSPNFYILPLDLNFLSGDELDPRITFTRASSAARVNASGLIEMVENNVPRFDYDPVTHEPRGLLVEEARTNVLLRSAEFDNAWWTKASILPGIAPVVTANYGIAPDGSQSADRVQLDSGASGYSALASQSLSLSAGNPYTSSIWLKSLSGNVALTLYASTGTTTITVTENWQRFTYTRNADPASNEFRLAKRDVWGTAGTADLLVWGAQLEAGASASSYIPTAGSQVTRAADAAAMIGANFSDWYNPTEGTFIVEFSLDGLPPASQYAEIWKVHDGSSNNRILTRVTDTGLVNMVCVTAGATQTSSFTANKVIPGEVHKVAMRFKTNDLAVCLDTGALVKVASATLPVVDRLHLGLNSLIHMRRLRYLPRSVSDAELQGLAA